MSGNPTRVYHHLLPAQTRPGLIGFAIGAAGRGFKGKSAIVFPSKNTQEVLAMALARRYQISEDGATAILDLKNLARRRIATLEPEDQVTRLDPEVAVRLTVLPELIAAIDSPLEQVFKPEAMENCKIEGFYIAEEGQTASATLKNLHAHMAIDTDIPGPCFSALVGYVLDDNTGKAHLVLRDTAKPEENFWGLNGVNRVIQVGMVSFTADKYEFSTMHGLYEDTKRSRKVGNDFQSLIESLRGLEDRPRPHRHELRDPEQMLRDLNVRLREVVELKQMEDGPEKELAHARLKAALRVDIMKMGGEDPEERRAREEVKEMEDMMRTVFGPNSDVQVIKI